MMSKKSPQLRFEGFTDDWEERKLSEGTSKIGDGLHGTPNYSDNGDVFFINGNNLVNGKIVITKETKLVTESNQSKDDKLLNRDTILMSINGTIGNLAWYNNERVMLGKSAAYLTVSNFDKKFIFSYLQTSTIKNYFLNNLTGTTIKNLGLKTIRDTTLFVPTLEEQQKIGSLFKQLDDTIALHQRKLDLLKEQKKGYLQKMFPKNCEKVPELRFEGFADDWEERKLSSMTNYKNGKSHEDKQSTSGKLELINLNSISISGGLKHSGKFIDEADDTLQKDDLVMILSDVGHGDLLGRVALIPEDDRFVLNQRVALLRPNTTADPQFLFSYINAHQYYFKAQGAGMSQLNISKGSVENFISFVPIIEEQKKIGAFYKRLDDTIALHQRKLDLLKEQKKGFLQKMFV